MRDWLRFSLGKAASSDRKRTQRKTRKNQRGTKLEGESGCDSAPHVSLGFVRFALRPVLRLGNSPT
jgi:hypothetical protein